MPEQTEKTHEKKTKEGTEIRTLGGKLRGFKGEKAGEPDPGEGKGYETEFTAEKVGAAKAAPDPNAPKRSDYPDGLGGEAAYQKANREYYRSKQEKAMKKAQ